MLVALVPCAVVVAAGLAGSRPASRRRAALLCRRCNRPRGSGGPRYQRLNWRGAARALGPPAADRAIVVTRPLPAKLLRFYLPGVREMPARCARTGDDAVALATLRRYGLGTPRPPRPVSFGPPAGFSVVELVQTPTYTLVRLVARERRRLPTSSLSALAVDDYPAVLLQGVRRS